MGGAVTPIQQEQFSAISCLPTKGEVSTGHFPGDCQKAAHCPLELILGTEVTRKNYTLISHGGSPGPLIRAPKPLILRRGIIKGWVFINHSEAQTRRSPLCNTPSSGTPSAKPVPTPPTGPSEDTVPPQSSLFLLLLQAPQRTLSMLHGSNPHSTLKDCHTVYWKSFLSLHPRKSIPPILSLGTSASHTH